MLEMGSLNLMLAQDEQVLPATTGEAPLQGGTVAPGGSGAASPPAGGTAPASSIPSPFILMTGLVVAVMFVFSMMSQRKEKKRREAALGAIKKHDRVQTIGGVIGLVVELKPDYVVLKVDESSNTRITFSRAAVQQVLTSTPDTGSIKAE